MSERKLASIQLIDNMTPIVGKDRICSAQVLGWNVIVQKDQFNIGDKVVYIEIDSQLPDKPEFEFLHSKKFRIRTMKMSGTISEGICFPMSILPNANYNVGDDVTNIIGVKKYDPYYQEDNDTLKQKNSIKYPAFLMKHKWFRKIVCSSKKEYKGFPNFISKTDETRVQEIPWVLKNKSPMVATEKIDGQSGTFCLVKHKSFLPFIKDKYEYIVCSRNFRLFKKDNSSYWSVSDRYNIANVLENIIEDNDWVAIQGECIAPNVQGNKYKVSIPDLYVFNIIYPNGRLSSLEAKDIVELHNMKFVPIVNDKYILPDTVSEILNYATGNSLIGDTLREGLVIRDENGANSFKAVSQEFLIHYGI